MTRLLLASALGLAFAFACTTHESGADQPVITGDPCGVHQDQQTCAADTADSCHWYDLGRPCQIGQPCVSGVCSGPTSGSGGSGSGHVTGCACAVAGGGAEEVCYEQIGGVACQACPPPAPACIEPAPGSGDPCARIQGQGHCSASPTVQGLCLCDNGVR